jgi:phosphatidyl-myo-inositol dimannoside synthase
VRRHLLVTNDFPPKVGGIQSYLWELWQRLDPDSFAVLTASSHPDAPTFDAEQASRGVRIERVPQSILFFPTPAARARVRAAAAASGASLVVLDPALPLGLLGPSLGIPYGVVLHGAEVTVPGRLPVGRQALGHVLRHAAIVVSAGSYPAAEAARALARRPRARTATGGRLEAGWSPGREAGTRQVCVQVPPGVDCERYARLDDGGRLAARVRLGLPATGLLVTSVSRLVPRKGMDVLIEAANRLAPSFPDLTLAIAGTGREDRRLAAQARRAAAGVRLLGGVSEADKAALLGASDVFAMACHTRWGGLEQEGFGIVFIEAAAAGVPQVAGDSGGAVEAVVDGVTGLVVRHPRDPAEMATAIRRLLADGDLRRRMGVAARARVRADFDYPGLAAKLAGALEEVQG